MKNEPRRISPANGAERHDKVTSVIEKGERQRIKEAPREIWRVDSKELKNIYKKIMDKKIIDKRTIDENIGHKLTTVRKRQTTNQ